MLDWATVRDRLPAAAALDEPEVQELIDAAEGFIESQTGRYFGVPAPVTEYLSGLGTYELFLRDRVQSGTPVVTERTGPTAAETAVTGFERRDGRRATVLLRTDGSPWYPHYEYKVIYQRGYDLETAPADVRQLALELIGFRLNMQGREGLRSESLGNYAFTRFGDGDLDAIDGAWPTIRAWRRAVMV